MTKSQTYLNTKISTTVTQIAATVVMGTQITLISLQILSLFYSIGVNRKSRLKVILSFMTLLRLLIGVFLYIPVLDLMSYSTSCYSYSLAGSSTKVMRSAVSPELPCVLSEVPGLLEQMFVYASVVSMILHLKVGMTFAYVDYNARISQIFNVPK